MIVKKEVRELLKSDETYRIEKTVSVTNTDKFSQAICAFSNDMPASGKNGYLIIGANDDGSLSGLTVSDELMKNISAIRSDGNILPLPVMNVEKFTFDEGDILVVEVKPSLYPPVRYRGRVYIRIGPRKDFASEEEERLLSERRTAKMVTFDMVPCQNATLDDINTKIIMTEFLPKAIDHEVLAQDKRNLKEQMASLRLYDLRLDCPTYAAVILFGKNPKYFLPGNYIQFVRFAGEDKASDIENEKTINGNLWEMLPKLDVLLDYSIIEQRPVAISTLKEKTIFNYPQWAVRELLMNAVMHRDYQSNTPIRLYHFRNRLEIMNAGGLYGNARPENFPTVNDYRNPILSEAMKLLGYVNKFNRGIDRVQMVLKENGNPLAQFTVDKLTVFEVVVSEPNLDLSKGTKLSTKSGTKSGTKSYEEIKEAILVFCSVPQSLTDIADQLGYKDKSKFRTKYINPLLGKYIEMTIPDKPNSSLQRYVTIPKSKK